MTDSPFAAMLASLHGLTIVQIDAITHEWFRTAPTSEEELDAVNNAPDPLDVIPGEAWDASVLPVIEAAQARVAELTSAAGRTNSGGFTSGDGLPVFIDEAVRAVGLATERAAGALLLREELPADVYDRLTDVWRRHIGAPEGTPVASGGDR